MQQRLIGKEMRSKGSWRVGRLREKVDDAQKEREKCSKKQLRFKRLRRLGVKWWTAYDAAYRKKND